MAEKTKRLRLDIEGQSHDFLKDDKVAQCLAKNPSTVFACETSADTRYIKCDFPHCSKHSGNKEGKLPWILNTLRNVKTLEKHIGEEIAKFSIENLPQLCDENSHFPEKSHKIITSQTLCSRTKKVLAVFNLRDPQSLLGEWIALFLNAAKIKHGCDFSDVEVITQSFTSRYELMYCITKLEFLKTHPDVDVIAMLSCHSSSQGQVFSCTPSVLSRNFNYEEFCSLHDFVQILQDTLGQSLSAIHVSSCFTIKLDCSHQDWPVDIEWLNKKLQCTLSGSTREVYETGSQVADLYLSLSTLLNPINDARNLGVMLVKSIESARTEAFPDLANEMGLEVLFPQNVSRKMSTACIDEGVSPPGKVNSSLHVVILVGYDSSEEKSQEIPQALADALVGNLKMRQMSDIRCYYTVVTFDDSELSWKQNLHTCIISASKQEKLFFIALGSCWTNLNLLDVIQREILSSNNRDCCYGIHFQDLTSMQAYFLKTQLSKINSCLEDTVAVPSEDHHIVVTGLVKDEKSSAVNTFPVLLYMIHLAIGENGERISGRSLVPAHLKYKEYKGPGISHWTLEDVYMETSYVLSGLSRKAGLCLLSLLKRKKIEQNSTTTIPQREETPEEVTKEQCMDILPSQDSTTMDILPSQQGTTTDILPSQQGTTTDILPSQEGTTMDILASQQGTTTDILPSQEGTTMDILPSQEGTTTDILPSQEGTTMDILASQQGTTKYILSSQEGTTMDILSSQQGTTKDILPSQQGTTTDILPSLEGTTTDILSSQQGTTKDILPSQQGSTIDILPSQQGTTMDILPSQQGTTKDILPSQEGTTTDILPSQQGTTKDILPSQEGTTTDILSSQEGTTMDILPSREGTTTDILSSQQGTTTDILPSQEGTTTNILPSQEGTTMDILSSQQGTTTNILPSREGTTTNILPSQEGTTTDILSSQQGTTMAPEYLDDFATPTIHLRVDEIRTRNKSSQCRPCTLEEKNYKILSSKCESGQDNMLRKGRTCPNDITVLHQRSEINASNKTYDIVCQNENLTDPEKCKYRIEEPLQRDEDPNAIKRCTVDCFNSTINDYHDTTIDQPRFSNVEFPLHSIIKNCRSTTVDEPRIEEAVSQKVQDFSSVNKNDCRDSKFGLCSTQVAMSYKSDNQSDMENRTNSDLKVNSEINECSISTVSHCNTEIHFKKGESDDEDEYICVDDDDDGPTSQSKWDTSDDLPLMANVDEVLVTHYVLNLNVNFDAKVMSGDITLFLKPTTQLVVERQFQLCLDCSLVDIESVEEIDLKDDFIVKQYGPNENQPLYPPDIFQVDKFKEVPVALPYTLLPYAVRNWCVRIWKPSKLGKTWPRCIRIKYSTRPEGKSLTWATDQDNRPCVFSPGAYINNRSLMPCQEPPIAMSTWQAAIHVPQGCTVLMSGNKLPVMNNVHSHLATFLYEMNIPLPCSTLALAIGWFEFRQTSTIGLSSTIKCCVFSAASVIDEASKELLPQCTKYITAACELLGPYPFTRMDLVILPRCFACMGLMSPNMAFLSQSILARDGSMCARVAHEISHSWFGLLIGAKDWSEEWLSEGFATYMEERIHCKVEGLLGDEELFYVELHQILKHRTLMAEFQHADENMQRLRPKLPSVVTAAEAVRQSMEKEKIPENKCDDVPHTTVTNGQVCSKKWTQIYYLKVRLAMAGVTSQGYFLLHYMASLVGVPYFDDFLKQYVKEYGGKLVNSEEFFDFFERKFTFLREKNLKDRLITEWLEQHGLPVHVPKKIGKSDNHLIKGVETEFDFWKKTDAVNKRKKTQQIRSKKPIKDHAKVNDQIQLVVLLERLLERDVMTTATLTQLDNCYRFTEKNAEVRHRWCELVVKHRYNPGYAEVKRFLIEDQGMGIYLFGELLISQQPKQKQLVLDVLSIIGAEMDQCTLKTVQDMLEGRD